MAAPTVSFSPACPQTVQPGAAVNLSALLSPSVNGAWWVWAIDSAINSTAIDTTGPQQVSFTAPTAPGNYTIGVRTFWNVIGTYDAPLPGAGNVGGQVITNESWQNDASNDLRMVLPIPTVFAAAADYEGYQLRANAANGDFYLAYIFKFSGAWYIQAIDVINGVSTVRAQSGALNVGDNAELRVTNGAVEVYGTSLVYAWSGLGQEFKLAYVPATTITNSYPQPTITNHNTAVSPQVGSCILTVPVPALTCPTTIPAGTQLQLTNGGATGGTWSTTGGTISASGLLTAPCATGNITVTYTLNNLSNSCTIQVTAAPPIIEPDTQTSLQVGSSRAYSHSAQGNGAWSVTSGNGSITQAGVFTPTSTGTATITFTPNAGKGCAVSTTIMVYPKLVVTPSGADGGCLGLQRNQKVQFVATGGSGVDIWTSDCPDQISATGEFTAPDSPVSCSVTLTDGTTGQKVEIPICVSSPVGTCIVAVETTTVTPDDLPENCCEYRVGCGGSIYLAVPGIGVTSNVRGLNAATPVWDSTSQMSVSDPFNQLTAFAANATATGVKFTAGEDMRFDAIITPSIRASGKISRWGITAATNHSGIDYAIGVNEAGEVEAWANGTSLGTYGTAATGMSLSVAYKGGILRYFRGGIEIARTAASNCDSFCLKVELGAPNVTLGGAANPAWSIVTSGNGVGNIAQNGRYQAPNAAGLVQLQADVNGWIWRVNVRVTQPTPRRFLQNSIWRSGGSELWLNVAYLGKDDVPILALDGSPDAGANPNALIVGETREGYSFKYERATNELTTDGGLKIISNGVETASLNGDMVEVRDTQKLSQLLSTATVRKVNGYTALDFGGKDCLCEMSAMLVKPNESSCSDDQQSYDVIYLPRVLATSKGFEWKFQTGQITSLPFDLTILKDANRPKGRQLFSVFFANECNGNTATQTACSL